MLSSQEEQAERRRVLANDARVQGRNPGEPVVPLSEAEREKLQQRLAEAKRSSTLADHHHSELGGRYAKPETVVGKSGVDPWGPPRPDYWAAADRGSGPTFGKQLHSVDRERGK